MDKFKRYLLISQLNLFAWLIVSSVFVSSVALNNGGVSNFGNHYSSVIFYTMAFIGSSVYIYLAAKSLSHFGPRFKNVVRYLYVLCVLILLVYISTFPRRFGNVYSVIHDDVSKILFAYEFLLAVWLTWKRPTLETILFFAIMAGGSIVALLSSVHVVHLMFVGQMVGALGFALLLVFTLPIVVTNELGKQTNKKRS